MRDKTNQKNLKGNNEMMIFFFKKQSTKLVVRYLHLKHNKNKTKRMKKKKQKHKHYSEMMSDNLLICSQTKTDSTSLNRKRKERNKEEVSDLYIGAFHVCSFG